MSTLQRIEVFLAVAAERSFRAAAEHLGMPQSVVSTHIKELEAWLGFPLLAATRRQGKLTLDGEALLLNARVVQGQIKNLNKFLSTTADPDHLPGSVPARPVTLKQVEAFFWLVKLGTLERAANKLNVTQAATTRRVQELSSHCRFIPFANPRRKAQLTPKGRRLLGLCEQLIEAFARLESGRHTRAKAATTLRIGLTELVALTWFPAFVRRVRAAYPDIALHPDVDHAVSLRERLADGSIDIAFLPQLAAAPDEASIELGTTSFSWFCMPGTFGNQSRVPLYALAQQPLLVQGRDSGLTTVSLRVFAQAGLEPRQVFGSNSVVALAGLVESGIGVACLPSALFRDQLAQGRLQVVNTNTAPPQVKYSAVFARVGATSLCTAVANLARESCDFS